MLQINVTTSTYRIGLVWDWYDSISSAMLVCFTGPFFFLSTFLFLKYNSILCARMFYVLFIFHRIELSYRTLVLLNFRLVSLIVLMKARKVLKSFKTAGDMTWTSSCITLGEDVLLQSYTWSLTSTRNCQHFISTPRDASMSFLRKKVQWIGKDKLWMTPYLKDLITRRWNAYRSMNFPEYNKLKLKCKEKIDTC